MDLAALECTKPRSTVFQVLSFPSSIRFLYVRQTTSFDITLSLLDVLAKLPLLRFIQTQIIRFVSNILPSEHFASLVSQGIRRIWNSPHQSAFVRSS